MKTHPRFGVRARRHPTGAALVTAAALTLALVVATAQAFSPPRGTPDLSKMTLQPGDLARGAQVLVSEYFPPGSGLQLRAQYNRDFGTSATSTGVRFTQIQTSITLAKTPAVAKLVFAQLPSIYGAQSGRTILAQEVEPLFGKGAGQTPKDARFGKPRSIGAGQQSLFLPATFVVAGATIAADFAWLRVDGVFATLAFVAAGPKLADSVAIALTRTIAAHISAVLGAAG
jgi:hypothetical protein